MGNTTGSDINDRGTAAGWRANGATGRIELVRRSDKQVIDSRPMTPEERQKYQATGKYEPVALTPKKELVAVRPGTQSEAAPPVRQHDFAKKERPSAADAKQLIQERRDKVADLLKQGLRPVEISRKLNINSGTVSQDMQWLAAQSAEPAKASIEDKPTGGTMETESRRLSRDEKAGARREKVRELLGQGLKTGEIAKQLGVRAHLVTGDKAWLASQSNGGRKPSAKTKAKSDGADKREATTQPEAPQPTSIEQLKPVNGEGRVRLGIVALNVETDSATAKQILGNLGAAFEQIFAGGD